MRVVIDRSKCVGAGQCVSSAPAVFDQNPDDGLVVLLQPVVPAGGLEAARMAERLCPSRAISLIED